LSGLLQLATVGGTISRLSHSDYAESVVIGRLLLTAITSRYARAGQSDSGAGMFKELKKATIYSGGFNPAVALPFNLRRTDFEAAMQDVYGLPARH
jgi:hypothetical protein